MREILKQIMESEQIACTCLWVNTVGQLMGRITTVTDEIVILDAAPNRQSGMYWTSVIRIDAIEVIDFRTDTRPLSETECAEMGLPVEEEENTNE